MGKVLLEISISLDGFAAGPDVTKQQPMGLGGERLHQWLFEQKTDADAWLIEDIFTNSGAVIVGGNTYHIAIDGAWGGISPFPMPAFVVTKTLPENKVPGFIYITDGIESALFEARQAAGSKNVWVMGGATLSRSFIKARLCDELHIHIAPVLLCEGIRLFEDLGQINIHLERIDLTGTPGATHLRFKF